MIATLFIFGSIVVATAMILLNERLMHRSVQKSPPLPDKKLPFEQSMGFRDSELFDRSFNSSDLGSLLAAEKAPPKKDSKASPLVATFIFIALLAMIMLFLQSQ